MDEEKQNVEQNQSVKTLAERVLRKRGVYPAKEPALIISRLPKKAKKEFIELAKDEFCSDYGMTLKWLLDGRIKADVAEAFVQLQDTQAKVVELEDRIKSVEGMLVSICQQNEETEKHKTMLDGTKRRIGK